VKTALDLLGVAAAGLAARKVRMALVIVGPMLGVAVIVGIIGLSESARGEVRQSLRDLGTNLLVIDAGRASPDRQLTPESLDRVSRVSTVEQASQVTYVPNVRVTAAPLIGEKADPLPVEVRATRSSLGAVLGLELAQGRFLNTFDEQPGIQSVVLGADAARRLAVEPGEPRTIFLNNKLFAVVGVLQKSRLLREVNSGAFVTYPTARDLFGGADEPSQLYVRVQDGTTQASADTLAAAISYDDFQAQQLVRVPSQLLEAQARVDATFRAIVLGLGGLSLFISGIGIANVMTIAVLQRASEIGIRRALGHTRGVIAAQFLVESLLIGVLGGLLGAAVGALFVMLAANHQDWVLVLRPLPILGAGLISVAVAMLAGIYPALRAARMEPLETLRNG
jgi:putative ABC transport system permease protein